MDSDKSISFLDEERLENVMSQMAQESQMFSEHEESQEPEEYTPKPPRGQKRRTPDDLIETTCSRFHLSLQNGRTHSVPRS